MAFLGSRDSSFQQNRNYLQNGGEKPIQDLDSVVHPMTIGAGGAESQVTSAPASQTQTSEQKPDGTIKTSTIDTRPVFKTTGSLSERLFDPLKTGVAQGKQSLQQTQQNFQQAAGPSRTFAGIGGQQTLQGAVDTGTGLQEAQALVDAGYTGPQGLNQERLAGLQNLSQDLRLRQQALGTGGGLASLIQGSVPGLTRGEAMFEAKRRLPTDEIRARDLGFQTASLAPAVSSAAQGARDFAQQRTGEEDAIREASKGYLGGRKSDISSVIQSAMEDAQTQQQGASQAYQDILGAPEQDRREALTAASPYLEGGAKTAGQFSEGAVAQTAEGKALKEQILNDPRFSDVKEYGPLELGVTKRGKSFYNIDGKDIRQVVGDPNKRLKLYERQRELEKQFGQKADGQFSTTNPLYFGDEFQAADPSQYLGFDPGVRPSKGNISSEKQRDQFNRITGLLGQLDKIEEAGEPFRAAQIFADAERYLDDEFAALEARKGKLSKSDQEWATSVNKARKKYKKKKRQKKYAQIGATIGVGGHAPIIGGALGKSLA